MFRPVSEFVKQPVFVLMCDHPRCGMTAHRDADVSTPEAHQASEQAFLQQCLSAGWRVQLDRQLCPGHAAAERSAAAPLIVIPKLQGVA